jgi:hypothetical protein
VSLFADLASVLPHVAGAEERARLSRVVTRHPAVALSLRVASGENVEPLVAYWGRGGRASEVRSLLESAASSPGGAEVDVIYLLPPFARQRLYTYPFPQPAGGPPLEETVWPALDFFDAAADPRVARSEDGLVELRARYRLVSGDPTFGDIILLQAQDGSLIHAAVYIADGVVFTRPAVNQPWLLLPLALVLDYFPAAGPLVTCVYRRNDS